MAVYIMNNESICGIFSNQEPNMEFSEVEVILKKKISEQLNCSEDEIHIEKIYMMLELGDSIDGEDDE